MSKKNRSHCGNMTGLVVVKVGEGGVCSLVIGEESHCGIVSD